MKSHLLNVDLKLAEKSRVEALRAFDEAVSAEAEDLTVGVLPEDLIYEDLEDISIEEGHHHAG
jgi:hypothetical protein